jgi:hypothetical protein
MADAWDRDFKGRTRNMEIIPIMMILVRRRCVKEFIRIISEVEESPVNGAVRKMRGICGSYS